MNKLGKKVIQGAVIAGVAAAGMALSKKQNRDKIVKGVKQAATTVQKRAEEKAKELLKDNADKLKKLTPEKDEEHPKATKKSS